MREYQIIQLISSFVGCLGFALLTKVRGRQILYGGIGGLLTCAVYIMALNLHFGLFTSVLMSSIFIAIYSEIMARINKAPATIFLTISAVPLIPGGNLYYMMYGLVTENQEMAKAQGLLALTTSLGLGLGIVIVAVLSKYIRKGLKDVRQKRNR